MEPYVSVIIPHLNDSENLNLCINALTQQSYSATNYEIIVVDNGSTGVHLEKLKKLKSIKNLTFLKEKKLGAYSARNKGINYAKGEIIAFTDSDCIPNQDWISNGVELIQKTENCGAIGGKFIVYPKNPTKMNALELWEVTFALKQDEFINEQNYAATGNLFTTKKVVDNVGKFDENFKSHGDKEWGQRVYNHGYNNLYSDDLIVHHPARSNLNDFIKRQIRLAGGSFLYQKKEGKSNFYLLLLNIFNIIPPIVSIFRLRNNRNFINISSNYDKLRLICVFCLNRYIRVFENFRLLVGSDIKN